MPYYSWSAPQVPLNISSISPAIAAALTDITPAEVVIPAGTLAAGTRIRMYAHGEYTTTSSTPTCILGFYAAVVNTAISASGVIAAGPANAAGASATAAPWQIWWNGRLTTLTGPADAVASVVYGQGEVKWSINAGGGVNAWTSITPFPTTAALKTVTQNSATLGINTTVNTKMMVGSTWSTTTAVTSMTCDEFTLELLG